MPEKRDHIKYKCPFCPFYRRSYLLPHHIIVSHIHEVHVAVPGSQPNNCLFAFTSKKDTNGFYYCFTCKKGIMNIFKDEHRCRWLTNHDKRKQCKISHRALFEAFTKEQTQRKDILQRETTLSIPDISCNYTENTIDNLWNTLKNKSKLYSIMDEVESTHKDFYSDESENYMFDTSLGFEDCITMAIGYKKELDKKSAENKQLYEDTCKMDNEIILYKNKIEMLSDIISALKKQNTL